MLTIVTSQEMRGMDQTTIENIGIPGVVLMENAGVGTTRVIQNLLADTPQPLVYVFCGKGNNGGDGFVIARHLWDAGAEVNIFIAGAEKDVKGDALTNYNAIRKLDIPVRFVNSPAELKEIPRHAPDIVVDALLGTGIQGAVHGFMKDVIEFVNRMDCPVVSVDVPSGLDADSPVLAGEAVRADVTVTMALPKLCHVFHPAKSYVGELFIADIGIPHHIRNSSDVKMRMVEKQDIYLPEREADSHKYRNGKVAVIAGSAGFTGAATMSAQAALNIGAGLVRLAVPASLNGILESKLTEVITLPYSAGKKDYLTRDNVAELQELIEWCDVLAVGPGLGREETTQKAILDLLTDFNKPAVIDADALFSLAKNTDLLKSKHTDWIFTPHHGEFHRFLPDVGKDELSASFPKLARQFAKEHGLVLLLKGAPSLVASPDGDVFVNPTGNPGLASGGTGDVLTGMVAGLAAQGMNPAAAAYIANYLHGLCADEVASQKSVYGLNATDLLTALGDVLHNLEAE